MTGTGKQQHSAVHWHPSRVPPTMTHTRALKLVPVVLVVLIAALPTSAGATTPASSPSSSFGDWTATFSGRFDYEWSEPNPEPCDPNGDGSVGAAFSGRLGEFNISYVGFSGYEGFGVTNNTTQVSGYATVTDNRRINPPPPGQGTCGSATIDKSGCGQRGFDHAEFSLDSTTSQDRPPLHLTMELGGMLNAFAGAECYRGLMEDFSFFPGNSPSDSDTGAWGETYGALVGPRLTMAMFRAPPRLHGERPGRASVHFSRAGEPHRASVREGHLHPGEEPRASCEDGSRRCGGPRLQLGS